MQIVIKDQKMSEPVISHLRDRRSPAKPAIIVIAASVQLRTVLIQPIWLSFSPRSAWIGMVRSPKRARSAWWKKNAQLRSATTTHLYQRPMASDKPALDEVFGDLYGVERRAAKKLVARDEHL